MFKDILVQWPICSGGFRDANRAPHVLYIHSDLSSVKHHGLLTDVSLNVMVFCKYVFPDSSETSI